MRLILSTLSALLLFAPTFSFADERPARDKLGANISFSLRCGNKNTSLADFKGDVATVVVFLSFECPVSNGYAKPLADMSQRYAKKGVAFLGLTTNPDESAADVEKQRRDFKIPFPVVKDAKFVAADALAAKLTPEVFVLDSKLVLRYRGRIDNTYYARLKEQKTTQHDLKRALDEVLAGKEVTTPATTAVGCSIPRPVEPSLVDNNVTFYKDVLPILQNRCQTCHRSGEVGPFSLMNYRQAVNWAEDIKTFTQNRAMPPWKPVGGSEFHNERRLTKKEIELLARWVDGGKAKGNTDDAPPARKFASGWQLGKPDLILKVPSEFTLGPTGADVFRCFVLPTGLTEDKYVRAIEVRPGNPGIVHHTLQFIDGRQQGRVLQKKAQQTLTEKKKSGKAPKYDVGPGYSVAMGVGFRPQGGLGGWAPGNMPRYLPKGAGYLLPKGSDVVLQIHYHRNGKVEKDQTSVGLYFARKPIERTYQGNVLAGGQAGLFFAIPPGESRFHLKGQKWATDDFTLHSIMPHMHMLGKEIKVTMTAPGKKARTLIHIKDWDYDWQETYLFKKPLHIKAGTHFQVDAWYDNTSNNPANPNNPPKVVTFGEQTTNEMCFVFLGGTSDRQGRRLPMNWFPPKKDSQPAVE